MVAGAIILALWVGFLLGHRFAHHAKSIAIHDTFTAEEQERINARIGMYMRE